MPLQPDALAALHSLCQLSRSRQELAAESGAVAPLAQLVLAPPQVAAKLPPGSGDAGAPAAAAAARNLTVSLLCGFGGCCAWGGSALAGRGSAPPVHLHVRCLRDHSGACWQTC